MKRLTIHLKKVEKFNNKIHNTLTYIVEGKEDISYFLTKHGANIKKHYLTKLV